MSSILILGLIAGIVLVLNLVAMFKLIRFGGASKGQKLAQFAIVWLIPMLGAILVLTLIKGESQSPVDHDFTEPRDNAVLTSLIDAGPHS